MSVDFSEDIKNANLKLSKALENLESAVQEKLSQNNSQEEIAQIKERVEREKDILRQNAQKFLSNENLVKSKANKLIQDINLDLQKIKNIIKN